jgi:phosphoglycolate phosphatase
VSVLKYKGIIFDLDSTLVESKVDFPKMKKKMIKLLEEHGYPKDVLSSTEMTTVKIIELAEEEWKKTSLSISIQQQLRNVIEKYMNEEEIESIGSLRAIPYATEAIQKLRRRGYRLAILTRGHNAYAVEALKKTSMFGYFELILGRGETPKPKPYKEALEYTVKLMDLKIHEVLFIGDHQIDCDSAMNSGCNFVGVATGRRGLKSWDNEQPPDVLLKSVADLPEYLDSL